MTYLLCVAVSVYGRCEVLAVAISGFHRNEIFIVSVCDYHIRRATWNIAAVT